jgi:hypothetical protein
MQSFAVKHIAADYGPLMTNVREIRKTPYSFTSKDREASAAARGNYIYVVEVKRHKTRTTYWLGYKYRAHEIFTRPGGLLWKEEFKYKNSATPGVRAEGLYFEEPIRIADPEFCDWYLGQTLGMAEIPSHLILVLDAIFANPANGAKPFP